MLNTTRSCTCWETGLGSRIADTVALSPMVRCSKGQNGSCAPATFGSTLRELLFPLWPEDERAYAETAVFKQQLAERVGLPTRPTRESYDVVIVGAGPPD